MMKQTSLWVRRLGAGLLAVLLLVCLCACGNNEATVTTTTADNTTTTAGDAVTTMVSEGSTTIEAAGTTTDAAGTTTDAAGTTTATSPKASTTTKVTTVATTKVTTKPVGGAALTLDQVMANMPASLKGSTIKIALWNDYHNMPIGDALRAFEKDTGITVDFIIANKNEYATQTAAMITSGNPPDVLFAETNNIGDVKNLQPFENTGYDISTDDWDHEISKLFTFDGRTYAVQPAQQPSQNFLIITYSKLAVKKARLDDPWEMYQKDPSWWTWDKFFELCDTFLEKVGRNRPGYAGANLGGENYCRCFGASLGHYDADQGKYVSLVNSPNTVKHFEILLDAIEKGWSTSATDATGHKMGKILFGFAASSYLEKDHPYYDGESFGYMPIPIDSTTNPVQGFMAHGICIGAKNKEAVPYMIRYVFGPEANTELFANADYKKLVTDMIERGNYHFGNNWNYQIWVDMLAGTSSQVKAICDKYAPEYEASASDSTKEIANLAK